MSVTSSAESAMPERWEAARVRLRMDVSYDGTDFAGWAVQPDLRTVAGELQDALHTLLKVHVSLVVAGRTDSGVHAAGQVVHLDVDPAALDALTLRPRSTQVGASHATAGSDGPDGGDPDVLDPDGGDPHVLGPDGGGPDGGSPDGGGPDGGGPDDVKAHDAGCAGMRRRLAGLLPRDLRVRAVQVAPDGFDARFAALRRHYRYRIGLTDWGLDPLDSVGVLPYGRPLDLTAMQRAAALLVGLHDFAAYCRPRTDVYGHRASTVRELQQLEVSGNVGEIILEVSADAFCHSMVRALVGMLIRVGEGREPVSGPAELLAGRVRDSRVSTAPACGLTLISVDYPPAPELAARAAITRALRDPLPHRSFAERVAAPEQA